MIISILGRCGSWYFYQDFMLTYIKMFCFLLQVCTVHCSLKQTSQYFILYFNIQHTTILGYSAPCFGATVYFYNTLYNTLKHCTILCLSIHHSVCGSMHSMHLICVFHLVYIADCFRAEWVCPSGRAFRQWPQAKLQRFSKDRRRLPKSHNSPHLSPPL